MKNKKEQVKDVISQMVMKPRLTLTSDEIKDLKKWRVGDEHEVELTIKQISVREEGDKLVAEFEVVEAD